ncbi:hypothetical protein HALLA_12120 [Halostagnicola larsenii XH-48]|uniref:Uncharacterized protein n=1 Tax=Halostagnicola larsenii XH-48 TaxID=797299 RepID=W0JQG6_9EURY|nr:hypothetical protein [Halostagnicola larsenii]AHG00922.1 hypothetical protein HALLA_11820 [Halostagnicola larsenii XH-48]AHG00971.1 hypothetical protein HALLA_12120 [Halostagnicola larsenii XH-48]
MSSSLDPVQTIVDILEGAAAEDWANAGGEPDYIERYEETDFSSKKARDMRDAIYVQRPGSDDYQKLGAGYNTLVEEPMVRAEVWTPEGSDPCLEYAHDVREIIRGYTVDLEDQTQWTDIAPVGEEDLRGSARARGVDHSVMAIQIDLTGAR